MNNNHNVYEDNAALVGWRPGQGFWSDWQSYLYGGPDIGHCYNAHLDSVAGSSVKDTPSSPYRVCWSGPGGGGGGSGGFEQDGPGDDCPIVINIGRGAWKLTSAEEGVEFDIDGDSNVERIGWTAPGASLAFLAADLNANGAIDDGQELFGIGTLLANGERAANGFAALAQHDSNADGMIDSSDVIWTSLLLWTDRNHDGQSEPGELTPVTLTELTSLEISPREVGKRDQYGNTFRLKAHCTFGNARQPYYDIFFVRGQ